MLEEAVQGSIEPKNQFVPLFRTLESQFTSHKVNHVIRQSFPENRPDCGSPVIVALILIEEILIHVLQLPTNDFVASAYSPHPLKNELPSFTNGFSTNIYWQQAYNDQLLAELSSRTPTKLLKAYRAIQKLQLKNQISPTAVKQRIQKIWQEHPNISALLKHTICNAELERQYDNR